MAWLAAGCVASAGVAAQQAPAASTAPAAQACPASASELPLEALFGTWEARIEGLKGVAKVKLDQHPDYAGVRGTISRGGEGREGTPATVSQLAGDIDEDGMLSLDESLDGRAISGVWLGALQPASCGREFKGVWRDAANDSTHPFVLNKTGNSATDR
ncbi:hypothetical protein [Variovorax saccharolyticus]|uniref:hypothetical protein n=1 Tax=Variovorax saccharolyticus TaxID=3053516 RepID=UPI0025782E37|nr:MULTISPECIES: hypothetical protein [unclassified Variovorax]MDM0019637.1 hypothetical protein [Variovorax sp. J22R187]MDM0027789.1 hypothetical protein [Variovorax sp. J31P216]